MIVTLHTAFEYLARVAVFIEQARIGENLAINENVSFENEFRQLEDDHEAGLYSRTFRGPLATRKTAGLGTMTSVSQNHRGLFEDR